MSEERNDKKADGLCHQIERFVIPTPTDTERKYNWKNNVRLIRELRKIIEDNYEYAIKEEDIDEVIWALRERNKRNKAWLFIEVEYGIGNDAIAHVTNKRIWGSSVIRQDIKKEHATFLEQMKQSLGDLRYYNEIEDDKIWEQITESLEDAVGK